MRSPTTSLFAGAAAGVFAIGAVTGWMAPTASQERAQRPDTVDDAAPHGRRCPGSRFRSEPHPITAPSWPKIATRWSASPSQAR